MQDEMRMVEVPASSLSNDALRGIIEEFVTRDGTEFGDMCNKADRVKSAILAGNMHIVFDPTTETVNIISRDEFEDAAHAGHIEGYHGSLGNGKSKSRC